MGGEPFGVLLGDTIYNSRVPILSQLSASFRRLGGHSSVIAVQAVSAERTRSYGMIKADSRGKRTWHIASIVEKPGPAKTPSTLAVTGAYILTPAIFDAIRKTPLARNGEYLLADALDKLMLSEELFGYEFRGRWFDVGEPQLWLRANLELALENDRFHGVLETLLREHHYVHE